MNMSGFGLDTSQAGSEDFDMDNFAGYDFDTGQFPDQSLQPTYANAAQDTGSIRPSDLDVMAFNDDRAFGVSQSVESTLQIDPTLAESKGALGRQMLGRPLTPPTSLSPVHPDAISSRRGSMTGAAAPNKSSNHKRKTGTAENEVGDVDTERKLKNRLAASKCRVKKKGREQVLIQEKDQKEQVNMKLKEEYRQLTQEALWCKDQLILHGNCGDASINQWLTNSAARIVHHLNDAPLRQLDTTSELVAQAPSAKPVSSRRASGTPAKQAGHGNASPTGRAFPVRIGLESPVEQTTNPNVHDPQPPLKSDPDVDSMGGELMKRVRSLDRPTLDTLAKLAASRAHSVPAQQPDVPMGTDDSYYDDDCRQNPPIKGRTSSVFVSASSMTIDPRLRDGGMPLDSPADYFNMPVHQDGQNSSELLQNLGAKWMEA